MFQQLKNIDSAFRYVRSFSIITFIGSLLLCCCVIFKSYQIVQDTQERIYILANDKALEAFAAERKDNIPVEARDHVKMFHLFFFTLHPDDRFIQDNISRALYLADGTAKKQYDNLRENSYYANIISGNISQEVEVTEIQIDVSSYPYRFRCEAIQTIIRTTSIATRSLITEGYLRNVARSDNNPHGFLIERWKTLENKDLKTQNR
ncbi:conjugative transposon protein TraK [Pseudochryseolinea flava]|uniref:Conjugative transposon protein TraK n=1 Tax=Pseudochryseolinea flava TaxID=2059302 RepID=A0A364XXB3_9BACT|nr:conjugative transposon protein TraK [Pseudochryseolinea flava]RAV98854.1 conjugative transposon protein TraK [Pseudochryseolinea flava]